MSAKNNTWNDGKLVDGWRSATNDGAPCFYHPRGGLVAFNEDQSALYVADVKEVPFSVISALVARARAEGRREVTAGKADQFEAIDVESVLRKRVKELMAALAERDKRIRELEGRRRESRQLLRRLVIRIQSRERDPGLVLAERDAAMVDDYLARTRDPGDVLRALPSQQPKEE